MNIAHVIKRPIITEKSTNMVKANKYTFEVEISANKDLIKKAVEKLFDVHVISVSTVTVKGRTKRSGKKRTEKTLSAFKKAIVGLKTGDKIALFDLPAAEK